MADLTGAAPLIAAPPETSDGGALLQSKTFWGAVVSLVAVVAAGLGKANVASWAQDPHTIDTIMSVVAVAGSLFSVFGRITATKKITSVLPKAPS